MTIAFWCVLIAGLMPYVAVGIAKSKPGYDNASPRTWVKELDGFHARAYAAQLNCFEALPLFAAAVIIAHLRHAGQHSIDLLAMSFIAARLAYSVFYIANLASLRSLAWLVGMICVISMFVVA